MESFNLDNVCYTNNNNRNDYMMIIAEVYLNLKIVFLIKGKKEEEKIIIFKMKMII